MNEDGQEKKWIDFTDFLCLRGTSILLVVDEGTGIFASIIEPVSYRSNQSKSLLHFKIKNDGASFYNETQYQPLLVFCNTWMWHPLWCSFIVQMSLLWWFPLETQGPHGAKHSPPQVPQRSRALEGHPWRRWWRKGRGGERGEGVAAALQALRTGEVKQTGCGGQTFVPLLCSQQSDPFVFVDTHATLPHIYRGDPVCLFSGLLAVVTRNQQALGLTPEKSPPG